MGIEFRKVSHTYKGINAQYLALQEMDLSINKTDEFIAICGHTGSGKSTAIQHMNALLLPTLGEVLVFDQVIKPKYKGKLNPIRKKVGLVFQFPEYQLFEETVLKDIMFAPLNFKMKKDIAKTKAYEIAKLLKIEDILEKSPFKLSGGQMRKVAIAGVLAMDPDILVLDEPTRGLDPLGRKEILEFFEKIHLELHKSIIIVTHDMDLVSEYAKRVIVLNEGIKVYDGSKEELFTNVNFSSFHLDKPEVIKAKEFIERNLDIQLSKKIFSLNELISDLESKC